MAINFVIFLLFILPSKYDCKVIGSEIVDGDLPLHLESGNTRHDSLLNTPVEDEGGGGIVDENGGGIEDENGLLSGRVLTEVKMHPNGTAASVGNKHLDGIVISLLKQRNNYNTTSSQGSSGEGEGVAGPLTEYSCINCYTYDCSEALLCHSAAQCFASRRRDSTGTETYSRGCIEKIDQVKFICSSSFKMQVEALAVECCDGNLCNNYSYPILPSPLADPLAVTNHDLLKLALFILLGTSVSIIVVAIGAYFIISKYFMDQKTKYLKSLSRRTPLNPFTSIYRGHKFGPVDDSTGMLNESMSSGSGSGLPLFVQRTLAKNIDLEQIIGTGRYGDVWRGNWHEETVAVKIFSTSEETSWTRETEIFSTVLLRHENILGFFGADKICRGSCAQLWLVTDYHPNGSLYDYLQTHILDYQELFTICLSIINGLLHLHTEIMGTQGKSAIAHRDLNSNNVLVKVDGTCCLSDFGLAVIRTPGTGEINLGNTDRSGTIRYMSPETLDGSLDIEMFESFRKSDIYSVALVMWEACWRCLCNGIAEDYSRPFGNIFHSEPTYEEMRRLVCTQGARPTIPNRWAGDKVLSSIERILSECWDHNPDVRLTALRIKKNLFKISTEELLDDFKGSERIV